MSEETTFRKKRIDPSEISADFKQVEAFRKQQGFNTGIESAMPQNAGNLPPAILQAMEMNRRQQEEQEIPQFVPPKNNDVQMGSNIPGFNEMLSGLKSHTYEKITLPSRGKFYNGNDVPSNGVLHVRPMTGREEEYLASQRFVKRNQAMDMIFQNCVQEKIAADKLLIEDRTYLLIYLRGISYSEIYDISVKCSECGINFDYGLNLDTLKVTYCPDDFSIDNLTETLPHCGFKFTYRLPTLQDDNSITDYRENQKKHFPNALDDSFLYKASLLISSISNDKMEVDNQMQIKMLLENMIVGDVNYLRNVINEPPFGVQTSVSVICNSCLNEFNVELGLESSFFFPKNKKKTE